MWFNEFIEKYGKEYKGDILWRLIKPGHLESKDKDGNVAASCEYQLTSAGEDMYNQFLAKVKVSYAKFSKIDFIKLLQYHCIFNLIGEKQTRVLSVPLSEFKILNEFAPLLRPKAVKYDTGDILTLNLLGDRENNAVVLEEEGNFSLQDYNVLCSKFRSCFKSTLVNDTQPLDQCMKEVHLKDVIERCFHCDDGLVMKCDVNANLPIKLNKFKVSYLFNPSAFSDRVESLLDLWIANVWLSQY